MNTASTRTLPAGAVALDEPKFLLGDVAAATGVSLPILRSWVSREPMIIPLGPHDIPARGKGSAIIFTLRRVFCIAITAELVELGFAPSKAAAAAMFVTEDSAKPEIGSKRSIISNYSNFPDRLLIEPNNKHSMLRAGDTIERAITNRSAVTIVNCATIFSEVSRALRQRGKWEFNDVAF